MRGFAIGLAVGLFSVLTGIQCAGAQSVGSYAGTQANGQSINFTVSTNSTNGNPEITSVGFGIVATCSNGSTITTGIGTGASTDVVNGKATVTLSAYNIYYVLSLRFLASNSATGAITAEIPALASSLGAPKKALLCKTGKQTLSATLGGSGSGIVTHAAPPRALVY